MDDPSPPPAFTRRELVVLGLRWLGGVAALFALMFYVARYFREPLEALGASFVARFGYVGMAVGTFAADAFHFPVPPQFYMLMSVSSEASELVSLLAIAVGSLGGGSVGFVLASRLARLDPISRRLERSRLLVERSFSRFGYRAAVFASLLPVAYSLLCNVAGAHRLPWRAFLVLSLCRVPRLVLFYYLVRLGWEAA